jgi:hypothetical protein
MFEIIDGFAMWHMRSFSNNSTTTMRIQYDCVGCGQAALLQQAADLGALLFPLAVLVVRVG